MTRDSSRMDVPMPEERAAEWYLLRRRRRLTDAENAALQAWLAESPDHVQALEETERTWQSFDDHATMPELVVAREQALASVREAQVKRWVEPTPETGSQRTFGMPGRWSIAIAAMVLVSLAVAWQWYLPGGERFSTGVGEQRTVLLPDNSTMVLDAMTHVRVRYDGAVRRIEMTEGQAQFDVAADKRRPFRVQVGDRSIEALGTSFTVTYIENRMQVSLLEGRVQVGEAAGHKAAGSQLHSVLDPGDALSVEPDGKQVLKKKTDLAAATAWRQGRVIFQQEPLRDAVNRLNRYSRVQLRVSDAAIEQWPVSGIFGVGDAEAFAEALQSYFPIQAEHTGDGVIELRRSR